MRQAQLHGGLNMADGRVVGSCEEVAVRNENTANENNTMTLGVGAEETYHSAPPMVLPMPSWAAQQLGRRSGNS